MSPDDLEQQLQRRSLKAVPPEWRAQILSTAYEERAEGADRQSTAAWHWLPRTLGWRALAAVWVLIASLHFANQAAERSSHTVALSTGDWGKHWREERLLLAEITDSKPAPPSVPAPPKPRSSSRTSATSGISPA